MNLHAFLPLQQFLPSLCEDESESSVQKLQACLKSCSDLNLLTHRCHLFLLHRYYDSLFQPGSLRTSSAPVEPHSSSRGIQITLRHLVEDTLATPTTSPPSISPLGSQNAFYLTTSKAVSSMPFLQTGRRTSISANVVLGLMPALVTSIGPSVAEISLLSAHYPLLSFLISLGAPATIWPARIFEYVHPTDALRERRGPLGHKQSAPMASGRASCVIDLFLLCNS